MINLIPNNEFILIFKMCIEIIWQVKDEIVDREQILLKCSLICTQKRWKNIIIHFGAKIVATSYCLSSLIFLFPSVLFIYFTDNIAMYAK